MCVANVCDLLAAESCSFHHQTSYQPFDVIINPVSSVFVVRLRRGKLLLRLLLLSLSAISRTTLSVTVSLRHNGMLLTTSLSYYSRYTVSVHLPI